MVEKPHVNLVYIGHVDHGKSTLVGRILYESGLLKDRDLHEEAGTFKFAWALDKLKEERERGVTIDIAYQKLSTPKNELTIIDAPGHRDFVKNMITGTSQADAAVLVVAADDGIMPQTREHAALAYTLGVTQLIVAINKMDLVNFEENVYEKIKGDIISLLSGLGHKDPSAIKYIPISAYQGENVTKQSEKMAWYKGPTILEALEELTESEKPVDKPLRIPIQDVFSVTGVGTVPIGRVESGRLKIGDELIFLPSGSKGQVKTIEMHHEQLTQAEPGDNIGFNVRGISKDEVKKGDVAGHVSSPPTVAKEFTAKIVVLSVPTYVAPGFTPLFHCHADHVPGCITEIISKIDPQTGAVSEENPEYLKKGEAGVVRVVPVRPVAIEKVSDIPELGRFAARHAGQTVAAGMCIDLVPV